MKLIAVRFTTILEVRAHVYANKLSDLYIDYKFELKIPKLWRRRSFL